MILEKIEKNGLIEVLYESSNIVASKYNKSAKSLSIIFKHGGNYVYSNVPETDYFRFETAESQGKVLNSNIKKYAFIKEENVDVSEWTITGSTGDKYMRKRVIYADGTIINSCSCPSFYWCTSKPATCKHCIIKQ